MVVETMAVAAAGVGLVGARWYHYAQSEWAKSTEISFVAHLAKKYLNPNKKERAGYAGEHELARQLEKVPGYKRLLFNALLPLHNGQTTEADIIMIHEKGIYVFECKNYSASVIGNWIENPKTGRVELGNIDPKSDYWVTVYGKGKSAEKKKLYSPIKQNNTHMNNLAKWAFKYGLSEHRCNSYVVFVRNGVQVLGAPFSFRTDRGSPGRVLYSDQVVKDLTTNMIGCSKIMTPERIDRLYEELHPFTLVSKKERNNHKAMVNQSNAQREMQREQEDAFNSRFLTANKAQVSLRSPKGMQDAFSRQGQDLLEKKMREAEQVRSETTKGSPKPRLHTTDDRTL